MYCTSLFMVGLALRLGELLAHLAYLQQQGADDRYRVVQHLLPGVYILQGINFFHNPHFSSSSPSFYPAPPKPFYQISQEK